MRRAQLVTVQLKTEKRQNFNGWLNSVTGVLLIGMTWAVFGAIAGHNFLSRMVLCDSPICESLRIDGNLVRMNNKDFEQ